MGIYEPVQDGTGVFSGGVGKDSPYGKQTGQFRPKLFGRAGRFGPVISGAKYIGRYFRKNPRFGARIGAVAGGAGVKYYASQSKYRQALRTTQSRSYRSWRYNKYRSRNCCCCTGRKSQHRG